MKQRPSKGGQSGKVFVMLRDIDEGPKSHHDALSDNRYAPVGITGDHTLEIPAERHDKLICRGFHDPIVKVEVVSGVRVSANQIRPIGQFHTCRA